MNKGAANPKDDTLKILVVDDKEDTRYLLSALFTGHSYSVATATNGAEALGQLRDGSFDLVISDILMPVMDGYQLCREVRQDERLKKILFIFYTATYVQEGDEELARELGADDFIIKPMEPDSLLARVQAVTAGASEKGWTPRVSEITEEADVLRLYSERLVAKLEKRTLDLDRELAERRKVEEALLESEERFRQLFSHMSSCVAVYKACPDGEDFVFVDFNEAGERAEGMRKDDIIGKSVQETFPGVKAFGLLDVFRRVWQTGVPEHHPVTEYLDQRIRGWRDNYVYKLPSGEIVAIYDDVTAQKQAEEKIRWLSSLPDENPNPVMRIANDGRLLYTNTAGKALVRMWGCEIGAVVPPHCHDLLRQACEGRERNTEVELGGRVLFLTLNPVAGEDYVNVYSADVTGMRQAEEALRRREEEYRLVVEGAREAIFIAQDGYIKFPNSATMRLLGRTADEIASRPFVQFIHPEDQEMVGERHKRRLAGEEVETGYEFRFVIEDGGVRWGQLNATRVEWQGRPATLNLVSDVTERKQAEHERFEALSRFSGFATASQYGMGLADLDGNIVYANPTLARMLGEKTADACLGKHFPTAYYAEEASRRLQEEVMAVLMQKGYWHGELELRTADGREIPTDENYFIIRDESDQPRYIANILTDITDRKRAEEELRTSETQLSNALRIAHAGHWEYDVQTDTFTFNDNFYQIFRTTAEEMGGYTMSSTEYARRFCHPDDVQIVRGEIQAAIETDDPYYGRELEHRILYSDGEVGRFAVRFFVVKDSRGRTVKTYGVNQDITERLEAEQRTRSALEGTIQVVAETIETRDPYTAGHQKRVTRLAVAIARRMGLPNDRIEGIRVAATLHDIGKMSIPAEILSKPGKLSEHEFRLIQEHPKVAYEILKGIAFPWPVADIILQHHERLDGTGYPQQLTAEDGIFLEARILAVADVVEAMATHRPYRPALGIEAALEEIQSKSGTRFDSTAVDTCIDLFASGEFTLDE